MTLHPLKKKARQRETDSGIGFFALELVNHVKKMYFLFAIIKRKKES